ncbi:pyrimidine/purine nucleoside phosphorylase [Plantibacter sp. Mn2098]|uniref:pyrimidine/purine nucleoside phosphorylase n=1 Tax=Plantibacter sp. Mn2098 TaxID=3395266 RepID=UPI003BEB78E3
MLTSNDYFDGAVKSIGFPIDSPDAATASVGVMAPGEYTFGTGKAEEMTVVTGVLTVLLPATTEWQRFGAGTRFHVPGESSFQLRVEEPTAYLCRYLDA